LLELDNVMFMQPGNTESLIQLVRNYEGEACSLDNNRGGVGTNQAIGGREFEGYETPTSS
jgi:hypothetical protein